MDVLLDASCLLDLPPPDIHFGVSRFEKPLCCDLLQGSYPWVQRGLFIFTGAINLFGFYIIRRRSPPNMRHFSQYLMLHQIFATNLDAQLTFLGCPSFLFPMLGVHLYGIYSLVGFNGFIQLVLFLFSAGGYMASVLLMLFARQQAILPTRDFFHIPIRQQKTVAMIIFIIIVGITLPIASLLPWVQYEAKSSYQKYWPCLSSSLWDGDTYVLYWEYENTVVLLVNCLMGLFVLLVSFFTVPTGHLLLWRHKVISHVRRKSQTIFFICLLLQISLPMLISAGPIAFFGLTGSNFYNRIPFNNVILHMTSIHGAVGTITMILTYRSYRNAFFEMIGIKKPSVANVVFIQRKTDSLPQTNTATPKTP